MTTIIGLRTQNFVIIGADQQVSQGNSKLPFNYQKIRREGFNLIAGAGSVGYLQRLLDISLKQIRHDKISVGNLNLNPSLEELSRSLADLNFSLPLEHKHFSPFSFLIGGIDSEDKLALVSIGQDGSLIKVPTFYCEGSGGDYALSIIAQSYSENISKEDALKLVYSALSQSNKLDCYTNNQPQVLSITLSEEGEVEIREYNLEEKKPDGRT